MAKLTLSVDPGTVSHAKRYAKKRGTSVSAIVQEYLSTLPKPPQVAQTPPILRALRGTLRKGSISDHKAYLAGKYR